MSNEVLMNSIKDRWGAMIEDVCHSSSVPPAFLAALIAGESGGKPDAIRYEPRVFDHLRAAHPEWTGERVTNNATSWGLTQIMGINYPHDPIELADPKTNLMFAITMLAEFAQRYELSLTCDFEEMLRCWNTGEPHDNPATKRIEGKTYDPNYISNALERIRVYKSL
jgi:hypothetical protein